MDMPHPPAALDEPLPCALGLLVGTLALMTGHAAPAPGNRAACAVQHRLMARKIVSNLFYLQSHPDAPAPLRQVAAQLRARWLPLAQASVPAPGMPAEGSESAAPNRPLH
jgi:hypothetical protein